MDVTPLEESVNCTRTVLSAVTADQLAAPTPCASWRVADVVDHVIGGHLFFAAALAGEQPDRTRHSFTDGDYLAVYDEVTAASLAAFKADGVDDQVVRLPFGEMPARGVLRLAATDTFVHGWDLAAATGQATDLAPDLAASLLDQARPFLTESLRGPDGQAAFGPEQEAPPAASNADRLAAFLGRRI